MLKYQIISSNKANAQIIQNPNDTANVLHTEQYYIALEVSDIPGMGYKTYKKIEVPADAFIAETTVPGFKFAEWELKGVPVRVVMGKRDLENGVVEIARRDTCQKSSVAREGLAEYIKNLLDEIQKNIYAKALNFREAVSKKQSKPQSFFSNFGVYFTDKRQPKVL